MHETETSRDTQDKRLRWHLLRALWERVRAKSRDTLGIIVGQMCDFRPKRNLIIFSDPRGGSTWLAQVLANLPRTAVLWEPIRHTPQFTELGFGWRQFIPEAAQWPSAEKAFGRVFRGRALNHCTCKLSHPTDFLHANRMIVKFCRANAMIPWLTRIFDFDYAPIHLLRHPFAVVASQLRHGAWDYEFTGYHIPQGPYNGLYAEHADYLATLATKVEALIATWCLTNLIPLRNCRNDQDWITVHYEHLLLQPEQQIHEIYDRWGLPVPAGTVAQLHSPSVTTREPTFQQSVRRQLSKWKNVFDDQEVQRMTAVLEYFEVDEYGTALLPRVES